MSKLSQYKKLNVRKAATLIPAGRRPTGDPLESNFGMTALAAPGEEWPSPNDEPMLLVCQINLSNAPEVPALLKDIQLITFFVRAEDGIWPEEEGGDWVLRAYKSLDGLMPLMRPASLATRRRGFEARWQVADDYPSHGDQGCILPKGFDEDELDEAEVETLPQTKIGGWPEHVQSEPWWDYRAHAADPNYCLQIASELKAGFQWGDGGVILIARGTTPGTEDHWFLDCQSY